MEASAEYLRIVVLLHRSLLTRGIASRLMEDAAAVEVSIVDSEAPDVEELLRSASPEAIILDSGDSGMCQEAFLPRLLDWLPQTEIICVDHSSTVAQVISSRQVEVASGKELLEVLQGLSSRHTDPAESSPLVAGQGQAQAAVRPPASRGKGNATVQPIQAAPGVSIVVKGANQT